MRSYLGGALTVRALGGDTGTGPFRAGDERGAVAWLARGEPFAYLHAVEFAAAGVRRGFHAHPGHREHLYVFSGTLRLIAGCGAERVELRLEAGDLAAFGPGVGHGFIAESPALAVAFGSGTDPIAHAVACPELG